MSDVEDVLFQVLCHRYRYYVLDNPSITDYDYDRLERQLPEFVRELIGVGSSLKTSYPEEIVKHCEGTTNGTGTSI